MKTSVRSILILLFVSTFTFNAQAMNPTQKTTLELAAINILMPALEFSTHYNLSENSSIIVSSEGLNSIVAMGYNNIKDVANMINDRKRPDLVGGKIEFEALDSDGETHIIKCSLAATFSPNSNIITSLVIGNASSKSGCTKSSANSRQDTEEVFPFYLKTGR